MGATAGVDPAEEINAVSSLASTQEVVLRVSNSSDVKQLASAISFALQDSKSVTLRAVGAAAVNQAAKATAIARGYVATRAVDLVVRPGFVIVKLPDVNDRTKLVDTTAVIFIVSIAP